MRHRFGVAWYSQPEWHKVRGVAVDPEELEASYEDWLRLSAVSCEELAAVGIEVERVFVGADELTRWCREQELPVNAQARARFASQKLWRRVEEERMPRVA